MLSKTRHPFFLALIPGVTTRELFAGVRFPLCWYCRWTNTFRFVGVSALLVSLSALVFLFFGDYRADGQILTSVQLFISQMDKERETLREAHEVGQMMVGVRVTR